MGVARVSIERLACRGGALLRTVDVFNASGCGPLLRACTTARRGRSPVSSIPIRDMPRDSRGTRAPARARRRCRDGDVHGRRSPGRTTKQQRRRRDSITVRRLLQVLRQRRVRPLLRVRVHTAALALARRWRARFPVVIAIDAYEMQQPLHAPLMLQRRVLRWRTGPLTAATTAKKPRLRPASVPRRARRNEARRPRALAFWVLVTVPWWLVTLPECHLRGARARAFPAACTPFLPDRPDS